MYDLAIMLATLVSVLTLAAAAMQYRRQIARAIDGLLYGAVAAVVLVAGAILDGLATPSPK